LVSHDLCMRLALRTNMFVIHCTSNCLVICDNVHLRNILVILSLVCILDTIKSTTVYLT
jgi:hypothetical protein